MNIQKGTELFNNSEFFEAHDFFEELWMNAGREEKKFYQAMVQISVGSFHLVSKNYKGALSQYCKGTSKLVEYIPSYMGIDTRKLIREVRLLMQDLNDYFDNKIYIVETKKIPKIEKTN